ncbi:hypothetical protein H671_2g6927 [Cricetulus griseus]|nr:hypothetical protein H671_2g6927 [Cricetulus griseus]
MSAPRRPGGGPTASPPPRRPCDPDCPQDGRDAGWGLWSHTCPHVALAGSYQSLCATPGGESLLTSERGGERAAEPRGCALGSAAVAWVARVARVQKSC